MEMKVPQQAQTSTSPFRLRTGNRNHSIGSSPFLFLGAEKNPTVV